MKLLVGIASHSTAKDYTHKKLEENMTKCVTPYADVMVFGDRSIGNLPYFPMPAIQTTWQDDYTYESRDMIRQYAYANAYDAFIWQGSDCYYASEYDFVSFINRAALSEYDAIGALTSGRNKPEYPVARRFVNGSEQEQINESELKTGEIIPAGFPGADALLVKSSLFDESWKDWKYTSWYLYREDHHLCVEEFWCMKVIEKGYKIGLDTSILTWHVHENGMASMWPDKYIDQGELSWN